MTKVQQQCQVISRLSLLHHAEDGVTFTGSLGRVHRQISTMQ